jgi:hypothetical protein
MNKDAGEDKMAAKRSRWPDVDKSEVPVKQLIQSFLLYHEDQNHTPKTVEFYDEKLNRFLKVIGEEAKLCDLRVSKQCAATSDPVVSAGAPSSASMPTCDR